MAQKWNVTIRYESTEQDIGIRVPDRHAHTVGSEQALRSTVEHISRTTLDIPTNTAVTWTAERVDERGKA